MCLVADFKIHNFKGKIEIIKIEMETKAFKLRGICIKRFLSALCFNKVSSWGDYMLPPLGGIFTMIFLFLYLNS